MNYSNLPDLRLCYRANSSVNSILKSPDQPLPVIFNKYADLEGFYRLIKNKNLSELDLMDPISETTCDCLVDENEVAVIHDTTFINPKLNKKGLKLGGKGLPTHLSLAVSTSNIANIFGPLCVQFLQRNANNESPDEQDDYKRWLDGVMDSESKLAGKTAIHLMDREGDAYPHFCEMNAKNIRYVVRLCHDRGINSDTYQMFYDEIRSKKAINRVTVKLSKREGSTHQRTRKTNPKREARDVVLSISCSNVIFERGGRVDKKYPEECEVNIVRVWEEKPPKGEKAVEWILATSEDIETQGQVEKVIKLYRRRWLIEEFFKGLKTGCKIEEKQFEDRASWKKLITFYLPIAGKLLNLRHLDQVNISSVKNNLSDTQIDILKELAKKENKELKTAKDLQYALANLGGHIKYNGPPGWIVLYRGLERLSSIELGWSLKM
jgi:hypothetical protein